MRLFTIDSIPPLYMNTDKRTMLTPARKKLLGHCPNNGMEMTTVRMTLPASAKFYKMLTQYLTTRAMMKPPKTWSKTTPYADIENPSNRPRARMTLPSRARA